MVLIMDSEAVFQGIKTHIFLPIIYLGNCEYRIRVRKKICWCGFHAKTEIYKEGIVYTIWFGISYLVAMVQKEAL